MGLSSLCSCIFAPIEVRRIKVAELSKARERKLVQLVG